MPENISIRALTSGDYDEALDFLNLVFSMAGRPHNFLKVLPRMWARDDEHMGRHLAVIEGGRIRAMLGIYPIPVVIAGQRLMFSTVGNVATHPYWRGRGYMSALLDAAMDRLDEIGADASRLGGLRRRYARYGYEPAGQNYTFTLTRHSAADFHPSGNIRLIPIAEGDRDTLRACARIQSAQAMRADRGDWPDFYKTLAAWESRPFAALRGDALVGYIVADKAGESISEIIALDDETARDIVLSYLSDESQARAGVVVEGWRRGLIARLMPACESYAIAPPCQFLIRRYDRVADALLRLKSRIAPLPEGSAVIGIEGWGSLRLVSGEGKVLAERCSDAPDMTITRSQATQMLFGATPPGCVCALPKEKAALIEGLLPLPLGWCTLDRV